MKIRDQPAGFARRPAGAGKMLALRPIRVTERRRHSPAAIALAWTIRGGHIVTKRSRQTAPLWTL